LLGDARGSEAEILAVDGVDSVVVPLGVVVVVLRAIVLTIMGDEFEPKAGVSGVGTL
jgi:hypothetical protein